MCSSKATKRNLKHLIISTQPTQKKNHPSTGRCLADSSSSSGDTHKTMNSRQVRTKRQLSQVLPSEEVMMMMMADHSNTQQNTHRRIEYPNNPPGQAISPARGTVGAYPMKQQSQPIDYSPSQGGYYPPQMIISPEHYSLTSTSSSQHETTTAFQQSPPAAQLSPQNLTPFPGHPVWSYTFYLGSLLVVWFMYLLLPRGFRKHYCGANRKRYARREASSHNKSMPDYWLPANQTMSDAGGSSVANSSHHHRPPPGSAYNTPHLSSNGLSQQGRSSTGRNTGSSQRSAAPFASGANSSSSRTRKQTPPSPEHPALAKIPPNKIISETMARLQGRGIRLVAHGVHCDPKRVWIKLDEETKAVTWQTEFPRRVPNQSGQVSIVLMRGSVHRIALTNVLYIDVGKKTNALQRLAEIPDPSCFSLLTQNGSLDLQANSKLERDALVSCFSMILDEVHQNENWRELYEASPDPSLANSSVASRHPTPATTTSANHAAGSAHKKYPNPSDLLVDV